MFRVTTPIGPRPQSVAGATVLACILLALGATPANVPAEEVAPAETLALTGFTTPARSVMLAPVQTGRIIELGADEGARLEAGDLAFRLDAGVQSQRVSITRALAQSEVAIEIARVRRDQAQRELTRLRELDAHAASAKEISDAEAEAEATRLALDQAIFEHEQALREYALQQALLNELYVRAPFTGYIAERQKDIGETVEERESVLTLVQLDPLVVVFDCPLNVARRLQVGAQVRVAPPADLGRPRTGEVAFISPVGDAASQTCKVKVHVPNPDGAWLAGMQVRADVPHRPLAQDPTDTARVARGPDPDSNTPRESER